MSSVDERNDPSKTLDNGTHVKFSSSLDQVRHILLLHKLANAYLSLSARALFAKFLDKREDDPDKERRAA
jgi:hypothetical protein